jgi:hypothetical protein
MTTTPTTTIPAVGGRRRRSRRRELSTRRLNVMRFGYAFMGVGVAIVKWPLLYQVASPSMPSTVDCACRGGMSAERAWTFT